MSSRAAPALQSTRLLDQVRERARYLHYSLRTEKAYLYWIRYFVRWHGLRHPRDMGAPEVQAVVEDGLTRIIKAGKPAGILTADNALAQRYLDLGASFVAVGTDVTLFSQATSALAAKFKSVPAPAKGASGY